MPPPSTFCQCPHAGGAPRGTGGTQQHKDKLEQSSSKCHAPGNGQRQLPVPEALSALLNLEQSHPRLKVSGGVKWKSPYSHFKHVPAIKAVFE